MRYVVRLGTPEGRVVEERHSGSDEKSLRSELEQRGLHVFSIARQGLMKNTKLSRPRFRGRLKMDDFLIFNQELAALLKAGLPLLQSLDLILERMTHPIFRPVLADIRDRVKSGENLSDAFASYGEMFPSLYASTLKAGERSGELEGVIRRFIRYLRLVRSARKRVNSALVYPAFLISASLLMLTVMALFVVPKFTAFYADLNAELPAMTRALLGTIGFLRGNWLFLAIALVAGLLFVRRWKRTPSGAIQYDHLRFRVPVVGKILHRFGLAEFCRSLGTLLTGGIPLVSALEIAVEGISNAYLRHHMRPIISDVRQGQPFYGSLEKTGVFTDLGVNMVKVGETTGSLDEMLNNVADLLDEQVETQTQRLLSLVEPSMLLVMAVIIGFLLISIYLPMFNVITAVQ
jgi:type IV pilus assembly protein PilC